MPSFFIMAFSVVRGIPNLLAAALITPPVSRKTRRIWSRSTFSRVELPPSSGASARNSAKGARRLGAARQDHGPFHEILQLANITRPRPIGQRLHGVCRDLVDGPVHLGCVLFGEVSRQGQVCPRDDRAAEA